MPVFAELSAAAQVGHRDHAAVAQPGHRLAREARAHRDAVAAVAGQQHRLRAVERRARSAHHGDGNPRLLGHAVPVRIVRIVVLKVPLRSFAVSICYG